MYDTEGITHATVLLTVTINPEDLTQPRDELERTLSDPIELKHFEITSAHVEFIEGRQA